MGQRLGLKGQPEPAKHRLKEEPQQERAQKQQQQAVHSPQGPALVVHHVYGALVNGAFHLVARQALPQRSWRRISHPHCAYDCLVRLD